MEMRDTYSCWDVAGQGDAADYDPEVLRRRAVVAIHVMTRAPESLMTRGMMQPSAPLSTRTESRNSTRRQQCAHHPPSLPPALSLWPIHLEMLGVSLARCIPTDVLVPHDA